MAKVYYLNKWVDKMTVKVRCEVTVNSIAKAFLHMEPMTPKKLQKMCYYAYVWYLTLRKERVSNRTYQAWIHGPVAPALYNDYKGYGWKEVPQEEILPIEIQNSPETFEFLEEVFASYGHLNGDELEFLSHKQDPWLEARKGIEPYQSSRNPIKDESILNYHLAELSKHGTS